MEDGDLALVWCHTCNARRVARWNTSEGELKCTLCRNTFVEEVDQGVEAFLELDNHAPPQSMTESGPVQGINSASSIQNAVIQQVIEQVLGINTSTTQQSFRSSLDSIQPMTIGNSNGLMQPMGFVVRQSSQQEALPRGLLGLLQSVASIRQGASAGMDNSGALDNTQFEQFLHHILMNESSHSGAPPASTDTIDTLPRRTVAEDTDVSALGECCISQEPFEVGDVVISLPCGHNYKEEPISHWLKMHCTCPVCRVTITP